MWLTLTRPTQLWNFSYGEEQPTYLCSFPSPSSAFTFSFFNLPHPSCKMHTGKHPPFLSEGLPRQSPHPLFALTSTHLSSWATVEERIRLGARVPAHSSDATPFSLPVTPPLPGHLPSVSWCSCLFMSLLVEGYPSTSHAELNVVAGFVPCLFDTPEVLQNPVPVSFLSDTGSRICPTQLWNERQAAAVWSFWFPT